MNFYFISLLILVAGAFTSVFVKENFKLKVCALFSFVASAVITLPALQVLFTGQTLSTTINFMSFIGDVNFTIDRLSAFFVIVISIMSFIGICYSIGYMKPYLNKGLNISSHCFFLMMLVASMIAVVTVQNIIFFLIVWEAMSISSFFLVIFEGHKHDVMQAGIKYLVYMHISVLFIISAFALVSVNVADGLNFSDFIELLKENRTLANTFFVLAFIGFGTKAGFVPFHNWLPDAHPAAPSHVSGIMSGVMIKTGIYGILRVLLLTGIPSKFISYSVLAIAVISAIYGVIYVTAQRDLKRFLAYSSIENIGIIGIGIAIGMLGLSYGNNVVATIGFAGGILHILNHSIFKELLFFAVGNTYLKTHTRDMEVLGGLNKAMPFTATMFIIGSSAICALPTFNGFVSEFLIYAGMIKAVPGSPIQLFLTMVFSIAIFALTGTMAILSFTKAAGITFLGVPRSATAEQVKDDVSFIMKLPMTILAFLALLIGIFPQFALNFVLIPVSLFAVQDTNIFTSLYELNVMMILVSCCCAILIAIVLIFVMIKIIKAKKSPIHTTWGCGYNKPNCHMQYTASSYVDLLISTLKPLFKRIYHIKKPHELFPKEAYFDQNIEDIEEAYIVKPLVKLDEKFLSKFERIQNGNIQLYIAFGLIFLVIAIICMFVGVN